MEYADGPGNGYSGGFGEGYGVDHGGLDDSLMYEGVNVGLAYENE